MSKSSRRILWMGGSPCSGKSTIAQMICDEYGFIYYKCDDHLERYLKLGVESNSEIMLKFNSMNLDETWIGRSVSEQVDDELKFYEVAFDTILSDISNMDSDETILIEGAACLPSNIMKNAVESQDYICVVPTRDFQYEHYKKREWVKDYLKECSDPKLAFSNWMERDAIFAEVVIEDAKSNLLNYIIVDGSTSVYENYMIVKEKLNI